MGVLAAQRHNRGYKFLEVLALDGSIWPMVYTIGVNYRVYQRTVTLFGLTLKALPVG